MGNILHLYGYCSPKGPTFYSFHTEYQGIVHPKSQHFTDSLHTQLWSMVPSRGQLFIAFIQIITLSPQEANCIAFIHIIMEYCSLKGATLYCFYTDHYGVLFPQGINTLQPSYRSWSTVPSRGQFYSFYTDHYRVLFPQGAIQLSYRSLWGTVSPRQPMLYSVHTKITRYCLPNTFKF